MCGATSVPALSQRRANKPDEDITSRGIVRQRKDRRRRPRPSPQAAREPRGVSSCRHLCIQRFKGARMLRGFLE